MKRKYPHFSILSLCILMEGSSRLQLTEILMYSPSSLKGVINSPSHGKIRVVEVTEIRKCYTFCSDSFETLSQLCLFYISELYRESKRDGKLKRTDSSSFALNFILCTVTHVRTKVKIHIFCFEVNIQK